MHNEIDTTIHFIYRITNKINGKIYIGQSIDTVRRWYEHKRQAKKDIPDQLISKAIKKYGHDYFEFEVIATCRSYEDANWTEEELIKQYDSLASNGKGYNLSLGGETAPKTEEWKAAMSAIKGGWIGRDHTPENIEKNRQAHLGIIVSEETKIKQSESMKAKVAEGWVPETTFKSGSEAAKYWEGKTMSEETKQKMSESHKGKIMSEEQKQQISQTLSGRVFSEETLRKMSDSHKGKHHSVATEFKKGQPSPRKGKKTGKPSWNSGKMITLSEEQISQVKQLKLDGKSFRQIEKNIGIARHIIRRELSK